MMKGRAFRMLTMTALMVLTPWLTFVVGMQGGEIDLYRAALHGATDFTPFNNTVVNRRNPAVFGWTPLHAAAFVGNMTEARRLVDIGAEVNLQATGGLRGTPLHEAAAAGQADMVAFLLTNKANANSRDGEGRTPLHLAAGAGFTEVMQALVAQKAEIDARDTSGQTPLFRAALYGQTEAARLLLTHGADINTRNNVGLTPLHGAVLGRHQELTALLLAHRANRAATDANGQTPHSLAASMGQKELAEWLAAQNSQVENLRH